MELINEGKCGKLWCYGRSSPEVDFREYSFRNTSQRSFSNNFSKLHEGLYNSGYSYETYLSSWARGESEDDEPIYTMYFIYRRRKDLSTRESVGEITENLDVRTCTVRAYHTVDPKLDSFLRNFSTNEK